MSGSKQVPHCVLQTSWTFSEADFKERVDKNENKAKPVRLLLHLTTQVILKLKIVFNLCLCSFFKRTRNRATKTSTATIPKIRILTTCVSVRFSSCTANAHNPTDLWTGNHSWVFAQPKGCVCLCFPCFCPTWHLSKSCMGSKCKMLGYYAGTSPPSRKHLWVGCDLCVGLLCVWSCEQPPSCAWRRSSDLHPSFSSPGIKLAICVFPSLSLWVLSSTTARLQTSTWTKLKYSAVCGAVQELLLTY